MDTNFKLDLEPSDKILFKGNMEDPIKVELEISNSTETAKAIKVKCTDNKLFRIRPPTATVKPGDSVTVGLTCSVSDNQPPKENHHFVILHTELGEATTARAAFEKDPGNSRKTIPVEFKGETEEKEEEEKEEEKKEEDDKGEEEKKEEDEKEEEEKDEDKEKEEDKKK